MLKRYVICIPSNTNGFQQLEEADHGDIVLYADAVKELAALAAEKKSFRDGLLQSGAVVLRQSGEIAILKEEIVRLKG